MKNNLLLLALVFGLGAVAVGQDTVRYGDPWYAFNTLPTQNEHQVYQSMPSLTYLVPNLRSYLGFENDDYTIYGIAVTMDSLPGPEWGLLALLLRGMEYHGCPVPGIFASCIIIDTLYQEDSIKTWEDHVVKRCTFEYFRDYDEILDTFKSTVSSNCYEFYFPAPIKGGFADTFFVAIHACRLDTGQYVPLPDYYGPNILSWPFSNMPTPVTAQLEYYINSIYIHNSLTNYDAPTWPSYRMDGFDYSRVWGGIFPIIAPRCSVPRGLALTADSLAAWWPADGDAQNYEVAVCTDTVSPDDGLILTTDSTLIALPPLNPDSTYRIYFRKECGFGNYAVWSDWSAPLVVDSIPDTPDPNGIDSATLGSHVSLSPNPTSGIVHVHSDYVMTRLDIYDTEGRHLDFYAYPGRDADLDLSHYAPGLYHLVVSTPQGRTTKQVIRE